MKTILNKNSLFYLLGCALLFASCSNENSNVQTISSEPIKSEKKQFPFYKNIEIKPGLNFEIISWGKGVDSIGAIEVLMSDSLKNNYKSVSTAREGIVVDAWNMDLDTDGNPELYVQISDSKGFNDLKVYEYYNGDFNKITFPGLSQSEKKAYQGNDKFFINEGDLFRSFSFKNDSDNAQVITKTFKYKLSNNSFSKSEIDNKK